MNSDVVRAYAWTEKEKELFLQHVSSPLKLWLTDWSADSDWLLRTDKMPLSESIDVSHGVGVLEQELNELLLYAVKGLPQVDGHDFYSSLRVSALEDLWATVGSLFRKDKAFLESECIQNSSQVFVISCFNQTASLRVSFVFCATLFSDWLLSQRKVKAVPTPASGLLESAISYSIELEVVLRKVAISFFELSNWQAGDVVSLSHGVTQPIELFANHGLLASGIQARLASLGEQKAILLV